MTRPAAPGAKQRRSGSGRCSLTEALEHLAAESQKLADIAAEALGLEDEPILDVAEFDTYVEAARRTLAEKFDPRNIEGYDGSDAMEKARSAYLDTALEMYTIMVETSHQDSDLASKIGDSLFKELMEYYRTAQHANERVIFTTEQRTALESAFLLKPKLNTAEKRAIAKTCNLNPRQVEVWFSNRRTRKKREEKRLAQRRGQANGESSEPAEDVGNPNEQGGLSASAAEQRRENVR